METRRIIMLPAAKLARDSRGWVKVLQKPNLELLDCSTARVKVRKKKSPPNQEWWSVQLW